MPAQPENQSVVGEDGELVQPDTSVDPDAYAEYVETYVHRDPLLYRAREHIKEWGYAYLALIPISFCSMSLFVDVKSVEDLLLVIGVLILAVGIGYWTLNHDVRP